MKREVSAKRVGFECANPECGQWVGDPRYVGPAGHAPQNLCLECWLAHWDVVASRAAAGDEWTELDQVLWLVCRGLSFSAAAEVIGRHRNTLRRWILRMRRNPALIPDWLVEADRRARWPRVPI